MKLPNFNNFLLSLQASNYSPATLYNYKRDLIMFEKFLKKHKIGFNDITKFYILNFKNYLISDRELSGYTINRMLSCLRSYLKYLIDIDYQVPISPDMIKLVKTEKKQFKLSELKDLVKLIEFPTIFEQNKTVALRNRAMLEVLFSTGIRISELLNLKRTDINQDKILIKGKGRKERFVYLTNRAKKHLNNYLEIRNKTDFPYLFIPSRKDKTLSASYLQRKVKSYREWLGIDTPISCHSIRHSYATYLIENGASPVAVQILLGHESLNTTTRYISASNRFAEKEHKRCYPLK